MEDVAKIHAGRAGYLRLHFTEITALSSESHFIIP